MHQVLRNMLHALLFLGCLLDASFGFNGIDDVIDGCLRHLKWYLILRALGFPDSNVSSPTFLIIHSTC